MADLDRFVEAQDGVWPTALAELRAGQKRTHWMWFVFPQIAGLGHSDMARRYAIVSLAEARAYLAHPLLGPRLEEAIAALAALPANADIAHVMGGIDAVKLRSSLTLFEAAGGGAPFAAALDRWFDGERDRATLELVPVGAEQDAGTGGDLSALSKLIASISYAGNIHPEPAPADDDDGND